jgi:hypothetical protein
LVFDEAATSGFCVCGDLGGGGDCDCDCDCDWAHSKTGSDEVGTSKRTLAKAIEDF